VFPVPKSILKLLDVVFIPVSGLAPKSIKAVTSCELLKFGVV